MYWPERGLWLSPPEGLGLGHMVLGGSKGTWTVDMTDVVGAPPTAGSACHHPAARLGPGAPSASASVPGALTLVWGVVGSEDICAGPVAHLSCASQGLL